MSIENDEKIVILKSSVKKILDVLKKTLGAPGFKKLLDMLERIDDPQLEKELNNILKEYNGQNNNESISIDSIASEYNPNGLYSMAYEVPNNYASSPEKEEIVTSIDDSSSYNERLLIDPIKKAQTIYNSEYAGVAMMENGLIKKEDALKKDTSGTEHANSRVLVPKEPSKTIIWS